MPVIPDVPYPGISMSKGWKEVMRHWEHAMPELELLIPLKNWPKSYTQGPNRKLYSKYHQRRTIATEFLDR